MCIRDSSWLVRVGDELQSPEELEELVIMSIPDFGDVTMSDVADIALSDNTSAMYSRVNGEYAVMLSLQKQPDYSTADVTNAVLARMDTLEEKNEGLSFHALMNQGAVSYTHLRESCGFRQRCAKLGGRGQCSGPLRRRWIPASCCRVFPQNRSRRIPRGLPCLHNNRWAPRGG